MKKQVLATIAAVITTATAHAQTWVNPSSYVTHNNSAPGRVVCTLTQLNPAGGAPISKTTLESPDRFRETTIEFKGKDNQTLASVDLRDGDRYISVVINVGSVQEFEGWRRSGETVSLRQPVDNKMIECTIREPGPSVADQVAGIRNRPDRGYGPHGGPYGGQQWTVGQTTFSGKSVVEARFDINSGAFGDDKIIDFSSRGFIIGYQVTSGFGPESTTNGTWEEGPYVNYIWGIGTDCIKLQFKKQDMRKMNYRVSVFYLQYPLI